MADPIVNFFKSTLVGTYSGTDTSITIATGDGALLPDPSTDGAFNLTIFEGVNVTADTTFEIVRVTARSGDVLTVTRGAESTTPLTIGSATHSILMSATKKTFDDINTAISNVDLTTLTGVEELTFDSTGDEEFGLPAGTTAQRPSSPSAGYIRYNTTESEIEFFDGSLWMKLTKENYTVAVEYLVIAGGGGSRGTNTGNSPDYGRGGGGAGGYRSSVSGESSGGGASAESVFEADLDTAYTVTVGAGGNDTNGSNSVFSTITSIGGGFIGDNGGSGGGADWTDGSPGNGTSGQGFSGGANHAQSLSGGGGGAGEAGSTDANGYGGDGVSSSITGSAVFRAGGGGGGGAGVGSGGNGGGGDGGADGGDNDGENGVANTGGGAGGGYTDGPGTTDGGNGGSGVVILRYPSDYTITIGAGLTGSETTVGANKVATITAGTGNVSWSEA